MSKSLYDDFPIVRETFAEAEDALSFRLSKLCFEGPESELALTTNAQPALLVAGIAAFRVLRATTGLAPVLFAGHSLGEFSAAVAAGALRFRDAVVLVRRRGEFMQTAAPVGLGTMIAVMGADLEHLELLCRRCSEGEVLSPANYNGAGQVVVAGHTTAVARLRSALQAEQVLIRDLKVSAPFHCSLMSPASARLAQIMEGIEFSAPCAPLISNVDGSTVRDGATLRRLLVRQVAEPVRWHDVVQKMLDLGIEHVVELGAGGSLSKLISRMSGAVQTRKLDAPNHLPEIEAWANGPLKEYRTDLGYWIMTVSGDLVSRDASRVFLRSERVSELVDSSRWRSNANGTKVRKFGPMAIVWPQGTLEVLDPSVWEPREDGGFFRRDRSSCISMDGVQEDFDLSAWKVDEFGTMAKNDGTRIIWKSGLEWDFSDPRCLGFVESEGDTARAR